MHMHHMTLEDAEDQLETIRGLIAESNDPDDCIMLREEEKRTLQLIGDIHATLAAINADALSLVDYPA